MTSCSSPAAPSTASSTLPPPPKKQTADSLLQLGRRAHEETTTHSTSQSGSRSSPVNNNSYPYSSETRQGRRPTSVMSNLNKELISHLSCDAAGHANVLFDIGGVLLMPNLNAAHGTSLDPALFKRMMRSHAWLQYYDGRLSWPEALHRLSLEYNVDEGHIRTFVERARASLAPVADMVRLVEALSATRKLKMYCMSNASKEDHDFIVAAFPKLFQNFENIFYSAAVGISKPNHGIFHHFVQETGCKPSETIFIDDTVQNVVAAEVVGFTTVLVKESDVVEAVNLIVYHLRTQDERLLAAREYLRGKRGVESCPSFTSDGHRVQVHYDHFAIAELLDDPSFLPLHDVPATGTFNFFSPQERHANGKGVLTGDKITNAITHRNFPDDLDTTAVALSALYKFSKVDMAVINPILDKMLATVTEDGLFRVYFDPSRLRVDHVMQAIVCNLFHLVGRPSPVQKVEAVLFKLLKRRAYLLGSLYYPLPESFLWHVARLAHVNRDVQYYDYDNDSIHITEFQKLVAKRVSERVGLPGNPLALAMRVLACKYCGISSSLDRKALARMQRADGSWDLCPFYTYNDPKSWFANELTSTAFAVAALQTKDLSI